MQCKFHSDRKALHICASCNAPLCDDCVEEVKTGVYKCFQCAMFESVSDIGTGISEKRQKAAEKEIAKKKKWGPFQFFMIVSSVLILVMWGVIIFGGKKAPAGTGVVLERGKADRVLLFLVDGALKRYAHYEGNRYPARLSELVPKYLRIRKDQTRLLDSMSYVRDRNPEVGYRLSVARSVEGEVKIILTAKGLEHTH